MKNLLITTGVFPPDIGGPAVYAPLVALGLNGDFTVTVLTYSAVWSSPADAQLPYRVKRVWKRWPKPFRQIVFYFHSWRLARTADYIYSLSALATGIPAALSGKPFVVRVVGDRVWENAMNRGKTKLLIGDFQNTKKHGMMRIEERLQTWVCRRALRVVVPSDYLASLVARWGVPASKIVKVANANEVMHDELPPREELRRKLAIPGNIIVSVGRLVPWKGFRMLIKLMPQFLEINPFFRLVIIGDGPDRAMLASMVKNLALEGKVYLTGKKSPEDVRRYVAAADICILNTGYEGFSHQLLEALSLGTPIVTSNVGGNRELIKQGENGFLVKYNDEFNIFEAVKSLWKNPTLRQEFSEEGKRIAAQYSPERTIRETKSVFQSL